MQNQSIADIDEYVRLIGDVIYNKRQAGCTVIKCALAYDRLWALEVAQRRCAKAMKDNPDEDDIRIFQNYVFDKICQIAAELSMPVQTYRIGIDDRQQCHAITAVNLGIRIQTFWLMHGSYPWVSDIAGLAHVYSNVWADLCWLPLISPTAAHRLMHELIDVCNTTG